MYYLHYSTGCKCVCMTAPRLCPSRSVLYGENEELVTSKCLCAPLRRWLRIRSNMVALARSVRPSSARPLTPCSTLCGRSPCRRRCFSMGCASRHALPSRPTWSSCGGWPARAARGVCSASSVLCSPWRAPCERLSVRPPVASGRPSCQTPTDHARHEARLFASAITDDGETW